jgi:hypothetical protein
MIYTGLFVVYVVKLKGHEIGEEKKPGHFKSYLPEYCVRKDTGQLDDSEYYLQFIYDGDEEYTLFHMDPVDELLKEEVSNCPGIEEIFKDIDLRELFKDFHFQYYNDRGIPKANYLTVTMEYIGSDYPEPDWDLVFGKPEVLNI